LVVWFHGGIGANNPTKGVPAAQNMAATWKDSGAFALLAPSAWPASPWWSESAVARTAALIDSAAKRKGVDASRVILAGASDGGTGALWIASKLRARLGSKLKGVAVWSCNPDVLASQGLTLPGRDLVGIPVRWTAGGKDRLYALGRIREYWTALGAAGWALETHENPVADHDLSFHAVDLALFPAWTRKTARK
jgi:predicted esterase